jgi:RNA polymerase sigma factor (sigma-70 family)
MQAAVEVNEQDLISMAQRGDREAYGELVCMHRAGTINVVYRMCGDAAAAEDAAQEAFIRAWQHLGSFQPRATFRSWLYRIAVNAALDGLRREKPTADVEELGEVLPSSERVEARVEQDQRIERVRRAVLGLPDAARAVLVLREYEGLSYEEIAAALEIPMGTVMSRLNYARKCLLERLKTDLEDL